MIQVKLLEEHFPFLIQQKKEKETAAIIIISIKLKSKLALQTVIAQQNSKMRETDISRIINLRVKYKTWKGGRDVPANTNKVNTMYKLSLDSFSSKTLIF